MKTRKLNHVAGAVIDGVQQCPRCGKVLVNARRANSMVGILGWFSEGADVFENGSIVRLGRDAKAIDCATPIAPKEKSHPELEKVAALIAAELLGKGEYLHIITKKHEHTGTWHKSNLPIAISNVLHQHIELTK